MHSHLAAALLAGGQNTASTTPSNIDEDEMGSLREEEVAEEMNEDFEEETCPETPTEPLPEHTKEPQLEPQQPQEVRQVVGKDPSNKSVTLQCLLSAGILKPGAGAMTIEYLGQKFVGDLLEDGKIRSQETDIIFASPSAWAIACKRFINPDKKSGCGWASVKYKGKKLDAYKNVWYKKKKEDEKLESEKEAADLELALQKQKQLAAEIIRNSENELAMFQRFVVKHNTIANRTITHDANTMIECVTFSSIGKIQPFLVSMHTNAALLMDFHCHLTKSEVSGYLAGHWDVNSHNLQITHAFPCRNTKADRANASHVEMEIAKAIEKENLTLVGWYHSHPQAAAAPTLRDVDAQLDYQIKMRGTHDNSYTPCIGVIISPYNAETPSLESAILAYWVIPPPENKPNEYGRPMLMSYSVMQDSVLFPNIKDEISKCIDYYKKETDFVDFNGKFMGSTLYIEKLKSSLISKFPRDENETTIWRFIRESLGCSSDEKETLISIPTVSKPSSLLSNLSNTAVNSMNANLMLPGDISNLLFNSSRYPPGSASSLLGLPDPMAHSTLAANNMFLSTTNLFKMQELLKPFSTATSTSTSTSYKTTKAEKSHSNVPLKIPKEPKPPKVSDFSVDYLHLPNKMDYAVTEAKSSKSSSKDYKDYSAEYLAALSKSFKPDFYVPNLSMNKSSILNDYNIFTKPEDSPEKPSKIPKMDYLSSMMELAYVKDNYLKNQALAPPESSLEKATDLKMTESMKPRTMPGIQSEIPTDFTKKAEHSSKNQSSDDVPLNLAC